MDKILQRIGGRKFGLVLLVFIATAVLTWFTFLTKEDFTSLTKMLLLLYPASAIGQAVIIKDSQGDSVSLTEQSDVRKFSLTLLVFLTVVLMLVVGKLTSSIYVELCQWLVGIYLTGNVVSKAVDKGINITLSKPESQ